MKRAIIKIYGEVQDVGFRYHILLEAEKLDLTGWVRNVLDGTVEVVIEGEEENLKKLIEYCQEGPRFAKVDKVEVEWQKATGDFEKFVIR
ncbi:MAG: hypothetical protein A2174_02625 [Candidatus Portnoybacteria bacterium RBG_13_41_18]|uniref:acylphosphatase n=1 Tax=Candidatus Portnoybacteria bacterium RBG_13_41_18 TaxID=1801991 RepID=A0A1G2FAA6_9BACT|nr:MAG: hypothetical protein A2174_02625 [Candidatus Portnoybacteria bacterium RBG_13_41_18]